MLAYALSIFTGAFLLFQVQPLIAKYILPWFGGTPAVWTTCMLFFQSLLLAGYAYAHFSSSRLPPRRQAVLHLVLLAVSLAFLPIIPSETWKVRIGAMDPTVGILALLAVCIGLPYFVLSSTGPLMQQWFTRTHPGASPYRLYALSNIGSLLALLTYPVLFERYLSRSLQAKLWSAGLGIFVLCCGYCAWRVFRMAREGKVLPATPAGDVPLADRATPLDRFLWIGLPAVASMLLLATTNKLCQEVAVIPFLWILPLAIYLLTFIIAFDHTRWYRRGTYITLLMVGLGASSYALYQGNSMPLMEQIIVYSVTLFLACMVCHAEVYALRPPSSQLTSFYLYISAGGAIGGLLVAVGAPLLFKGIWELQVGLWLISYLLGVLCFRHESRAIAWGAGVGALLTTLSIPALRTLRSVSDGFWSELTFFYGQHWKFIVASAGLFFFCVLVDFWRRDWRREWRPATGIFVMFCSVLVGITLIVQIRSDDDKGGSGNTRLVSVERNFYGTLKVFEYNFRDPDNPAHYFLLLHGATTHGLQFVKAPQSRWPTTYYGETSGVGLAINHTGPATGRRIGVVGLGTGSLASYGKEGDYIRIYEINPTVINLSTPPEGEPQFTYLVDSPARIEVALGDARLSMERELNAGEPQRFDVLALDAFSSDAIPVHLLTREAFVLYLQHVTPGGVIAVHTSNRNLDLRPVVENIAADLGLATATISDDGDDSWWVYRTTWILVTQNKALLEIDEIKKVTEGPPLIVREAGLWTDDYSSIYSILK